MKKRVTMLLVLVLVLSLVFTGCGGKTEEVADDEANGVAEEVGAKDTLKIAHHGDVPSLDTHNALNDNSMRVMTNIYDPLVRMDKDFKPVPCIAEDWEISEDGTEYTFYIKEGVKFHNGDDLTIDDVVFSIERGMESPQASPSFGRVIGVEAVGDNAVKIKLDGPYSQMLANLALPVAGIISEKVVKEKGDAFGREPIGTGPYKLSDWTTGEKVVIEAFEDYHEGPAPIKKVEFITITDKSAGVISLEKGDIDAYVDINPSDFKRVEQIDSLTLHKGGTFGFHYIGLTVTKAPFDNVKVRQAIAHAVDKQAIIEGILEGDGEEIDTFAIDKIQGYTDKVKKYPFDLDRAKELLEEAGYADGFETEISVPSDLYAKFAQVLQNSLSEIGITANVKQMERSAWEVAAEGGESGIIIYGGTFAAPDVDSSVYDLVHSSSIGTRNYSLYKNPKIDELFDTARKTVDQEELEKLFEEALIIISEDVPAIPVAWRYVNIATKKELKNVYTNPYSFYYVYDYSW